MDCAPKDEKSVLAELMPDYKTGDEARLEELKAIEVGNIFKLGSRFTDAFSAQYTDRAGMQQKIGMGCYGLGPSRLMGAIAECLADEKGLVWPKEIAPYHLHLVSLVRDSAEIEQCDQIYHRLVAQGIDVLYDDRQESQAGKKLADADLIGIADRIVVSRKMLAAGGVEWKARLSNQSGSHARKPLRNPPANGPRSNQLNAKSYLWGRTIPHYRDRLSSGLTSTSIFFHYVNEDFSGPLG
jgi:prolyl-tRNA synthetase